MPEEWDDEFYDRADAHIHLSNDQVRTARAGVVSASMMYAAARFNAWIAATGFETSADMAAKKDEVLDYFTQQYRLMLAENFDDYVTRLERDMKPAHNA